MLALLILKQPPPQCGFLYLAYKVTMNVVNCNDWINYPNLNDILVNSSSQHELSLFFSFVFIYSSFGVCIPLPFWEGKGLPFVLFFGQPFQGRFPSPVPVVQLCFFFVSLVLSMFHRFWACIWGGFFWYVARVWVPEISLGETLFCLLASALGNLESKILHAWFR